MLERSFVLGIDHHTADVAVREKLATLKVEELKKILPVKELYVLSTCNRFEVYGVAHCPFSAKSATQKLQEIFGNKAGALQGQVYKKTGEEMLRHGFNVASSLESMVLGEPQILGQMKNAFQDAKEKGTVGGELEQILGATFRVGKRVHAETNLSKEAVSVASSAVKISGEILGEGFENAKVLLVGAGEMCTSAAHNFKSKGFKSIAITNRTHEKALALAEKVGGHVYMFSKLEKALEQVDVALVCVQVEKPILTREMLARVMENRNGKPLLLVDIAVPRNVEMSVQNIAGIRLLDMDKLNEIIHSAMQKRQDEIHQVAGIINEEVESFAKWGEERKNSHMVKHLRDSFEKIRTEVLETHTSTEAQEATRLLLNKILHHPTVMLKSGFVPAEGLEMLLGLMFNLHCPRVKIVECASSASGKKSECPFLHIMREEGLSIQHTHH